MDKDKSRLLMVFVMLFFLLFPIILAIILKNWKVWAIIFGGEVILTLIIWLIYSIRKKNTQEKKVDIEELKAKNVNNDECREFCERIIMETMEDNVEIKNENIANMGELGSYKTPIYHMSGKLYYTGPFHIFINMNNPKRYSYNHKLERDLSNEEIESIMNKLSETPYAEETSTEQTEYPTGVIIKKETKKQTHAQKMKEEKEKEEKEEAFE